MDNSSISLNEFFKLVEEYKDKTIEEFIKSSQDKIRNCIETSRTSSFKPLETYMGEAIIKMNNQKEFPHQN